ncbi:hypothetical protein P7C70_g5423, partial [Phenoliferia sp. Uapishka_3]
MTDLAPFAEIFQTPNRGKALRVVPDSEVVVEPGTTVVQEHPLIIFKCDNSQAPTLQEVCERVRALNHPDRISTFVSAFIAHIARRQAAEAIRVEFGSYDERANHLDRIALDPTQHSTWASRPAVSLVLNGQIGVSSPQPKVLKLEPPKKRKKSKNKKKKKKATKVESGDELDSDVESILTANDSPLALTESPVELDHRHSDTTLRDTTPRPSTPSNSSHAHALGKQGTPPAQSALSPFSSLSHVPSTPPSPPYEAPLFPILPNYSRMERPPSDVSPVARKGESVLGESLSSSVASSSGTAV